ncbi:hypothetical protein F4777DRAFT_575780 [Nemania sp. FL0916]|nr:hypothetical protein F4777DRAFT_575780 [Nemania sp. FL0916]
MGDVAVQGHPIPWQIRPPEEIETGCLFTPVIVLLGEAEPLVVEALILSSEEQAQGRCHGYNTYIGPGFIHGVEGTYVWFNFRIDIEGTFKYQFRLTWRCGRHIFGMTETVEIKVQDNFPRPFYRTNDQDLLSLLEPDFYDPTPIELMDENL